MCVCRRGYTRELGCGVISDLPVAMIEPAASDSLFRGRFAEEEARIRAAYARRPERDPRYGCLAHRLACEERERSLKSILATRGFGSFESARILDVGCGTGAWLDVFLRWGGRPENLAGIDLLPQRITRARQTLPAGIELRCGNAARLEWPDASFDLVVQSTVFTSIFDSAMKRQIASEMLRVLKPSGCVVWYDFFHDNPRNPDVRGVNRAEILSLFAGCEVSLQRLTLAAPLGRRAARLSPALYRLLSRATPLRTHYLGAIRRA